MRSAPAELDVLFERLYGLVETSRHVFGSPLGPFPLRGVTHHLARFVYFGPETEADSVRLAFYAGFDGTELRTVQALTRFVENLAVAPDLGPTLNLSFFPLVNPSGAVLQTPRNANATDLLTENWARSDEPELALLRKDAQVRGYHGFVRLELGKSDAIEISAATSRGIFQPALFTGEGAGDLPIRWASSREHGQPQHGPLTLADDFVVSPFEIVLRFPGAWGDSLLHGAVTQVLTRLIVDYRGIFAFGLHL